MAVTIDRKSIEDIIEQADLEELISCMEEAFVSYSAGRAVVPPVGTLSFDSPPGDVHIKYGYIKGDLYYVIKIASGFYENPSLGISSSNGLNLVFSQKTGQLEAILLDEGYLTDVRTALAGAVAAKYLAPDEVQSIGIIGTGTQARMQLRFLNGVVKCHKVVAWGRSEESLAAYKADMNRYGFEIETTLEARDVARQCNLIVTVTPSKTPLLQNEHLQEDVHITAIGADTIGKQELDPGILEQAGLLVVDSSRQCREHGEIHKAVQEGVLEGKNMVELGEIITSAKHSRRKAGISVADLTGIATQDIQISKFVLDQLQN
jgi:ornithine cyclodeaminase